MKLAFHCQDAETFLYTLSAIKKQLLKIKSSLLVKKATQLTLILSTLVNKALFVFND